MTVDEALAHADKWHMPSMDTAAHGVLADEVRRLRGMLGEPLRAVVVEAVREATGCPNIIGRDGVTISDKILAKAAALVGANAALRGDSGLIAGVPLESTVMQEDCK